MNISGKKVTVMGGKRSGMAAARLAARNHARVQVTEKDGIESFPDAFLKEAARLNIRLQCDGHTREFIESSDIVVLSPGVPFHAKAVKWANAKNIPVLGEIEFAAQFCPSRIIAVTGSNGKTTVSTLISQVINESGNRAVLCGNVGQPFSDFVTDLTARDYVALETSSFQLESVLDPSSPFIQKWNMKGFKPHVAVILNFSQNHLDRHRDMDEYLAAKKRIFINQDAGDCLVLNRKDAYNQPMAENTNARVVYFNGDPQVRENTNHSAVKAVARVLNIDEQICLNVFSRFRGVEHRLEKVRSLDGVDFINDSKATTAQAALWALENIEQPIVLICGGRDKNIDFSVLADSVKEKVKQALIIGEARAKIRLAFDGLIKLDECDGLKEAVIKARQSAVKGDCVLLSPMCASFDMFKDFEDRGRQFKEIVLGL